MPGPDTAQSVLRRTFGFDAFRGDQRQIIDHVVAGGDGLVIMPTGGGKSLCYQVPALLRDGVAIVVSPLIALMADQVAALRQAGVRAAFINSSLSPDLARDAEQAMVAGELDLVYVAPERLCTDRFLALLARTPLALFAIDEAHCVSQWGHDFRPEYLQLSVLGERFADVPRIGLTATADEPTRRDIVERLDLADARHFVGGFDRPNIRYRVVPRADGFRQLADYLRDHPEESGIVYCMSRRKTEQIAGRLVDAGYRALPYHAGLDRRMRNTHQQRFSAEPGTIIVATIAFGMGIDKPDVRFVVHLDLPKSIEAYYQETGRAGRDGLPAEAMLTYSAGDATKIRKFIDDSEAPDTQKQIEHRNLNALLGYCETTTCRRRVLLAYFGEQREDDCGNCDTCLDPAESYDGTEDAQKALSNVYRTEQRFGAGYLSDVLIGSQAERITQFGHDKLSTYGIGSDKTKQQWQSIYRQLIAMGMLEVCSEYGSLRLTEKARPVLRGEQDVQLRKEQPRPSKSRDRSRKRPTVQINSDADRELFEALRAKRSELAAEQGVPPYVVFADRSLIDMAVGRPSTRAEMGRIHGVGAAKLERYGQTFLALIRDHATPGSDELRVEPVSE
jgi:ATP-dependent DNA helicase RecQ